MESQTTSGSVGAAVMILGTDLTGATSVTFNGTAAMFTVVSKSEITTTVPAGATTGTVQVVIPRGTLSSNAPFQVEL
ncbi:MAG: IPT/TIG domain-containing protein [Bryobacteraceae bacterium]